VVIVEGKGSFGGWI